MSVDHYENFPVASLLLPKRLRQPITHIYWFSRSADDIADEGNHSDAWRLEKLSTYRQALSDIAAKRPFNFGPTDERYAIFAPLAPVIYQHHLPIHLFEDLITAFEQDVSVKRHDDYASLFYYCKHSANPVGRLLLHLYQVLDDQSLESSDAICTALQLINFWQDIAIDWDKDRVYIPRDILDRYQLNETYIQKRVLKQPTTSQDDLRWQQMMQAQVHYARQLLKSGMPLANRLPGRIGLELRLIVLGGLRILERLDQCHYNVFTERPILGKSDWLRLFYRLFTTRF